MWPLKVGLEAASQYCSVHLRSQRGGGAVLITMTQSKSDDAVKNFENYLEKKGLELTEMMITFLRESRTTIGPKSKAAINKYDKTNQCLHKWIRTKELYSRHKLSRKGKAILIQLILHHKNDLDKVARSANRVGLFRDIPEDKCKRILEAIENPDKCMCGDGWCPHCSVNPF